MHNAHHMQKHVSEKPISYTCIHTHHMYKHRGIVAAACRIAAAFTISCQCCILEGPGASSGARCPHPSTRNRRGGWVGGFAQGEWVGLHGWVCMGGFAWVGGWVCTQCVGTSQVVVHTCYQHMLSIHHTKHNTSHTTPHIIQHITQIIDIVQKAMRVATPEFAEGMWADVGTGSGALALGLAHTFPSIRHVCFASEIVKHCCGCVHQHACACIHDMHVYMVPPMHNNTYAHQCPVHSHHLQLPCHQFPCPTKQSPTGVCNRHQC